MVELDNDQICMEHRVVEGEGCDKCSSNDELEMKDTGKEAL